MWRERRCLVRVFLKQSLPHKSDRGRKGKELVKGKKGSPQKLCEALCGAEGSCVVDRLAEAIGRVWNPVKAQVFPGWRI